MVETILIVDDDAAQRRISAAILTRAGLRVEELSDGAAALDRLAPDSGGEPPALVLLDLNMPGTDGFAVLNGLRPDGSDPPIIVLTSDGSVTRAVSAMQSGASDFLIKPVSPERLMTSVRTHLKVSRLSSEVRRLRGESDSGGLGALIARSDSIRVAVRHARRAAASSIPVLIEGESGVGKELFARAIHQDSARGEAPFVAVNCGAIPRSLVESTLFGHEKGAFTGADEKRSGKFQEAEGGTLFLDEVGELPLEAQVKLLRAVQEREVDPVGAPRPVKVDVRLISATNRNLRVEIAAGRFREDLFYRLGVFPLTPPPLRQRAEDILPLAQHFLSRFTAQEDRRVEGFSTAAETALTGHAWPGNVRELENLIHRAVVMCDGPVLTPDDLPGLDCPPPETARRPMRAETPAPPAPDAQLLDGAGHVRTLAEIETQAIRLAMRRYRGNLSEVSRRLKIGRTTLYRKLKSAGLDPDEDPFAPVPAQDGGAPLWTDPH